MEKKSLRYTVYNDIGQGLVHLLTLLLLSFLAFFFPPSDEKEHIWFPYFPFLFPSSSHTLKTSSVSCQG